jgi:ABC-type multidrug transport system fused ATPase/permease subunit
MSTLFLRFLHSARSLTVVIVAHRLSTVRNLDVIYVVEEGTVVEQGSHDNLVANDAGAYSDESRL